MSGLEMLGRGMQTQPTLVTRGGGGEDLGDTTEGFGDAMDSGRSALADGEQAGEPQYSSGMEDQSGAAPSSDWDEGARRRGLEDVYRGMGSRESGAGTSRAMPPTLLGSYAAQRTREGGGEIMQPSYTDGSGEEGEAARIVPQLPLRATSEAARAIQPPIGRLDETASVLPSASQSAEPAKPWPGQAGASNLDKTQTRPTPATSLTRQSSPDSPRHMGGDLSRWPSDSNDAASDYGVRRSQMIDEVIRVEGGISKDKQDYETRYGIRDAAFEDYKQRNQNSVVAQKKFSQLTMQDARIIYDEMIRHYRIDQIDDPTLRQHLFDMVVNMGPPKAIAMWQKALGDRGDVPANAPADGVLGPTTRNALNNLSADERRNLNNTIIENQIEYYTNLYANGSGRHPVEHVISWYRRAQLYRR